MRWTRFLRSTAVSLPFALEVNIQGIPAHAWELSTAELLLNEYCWISGIHPDTADRRDSFRVAAWCSNPSIFPSKMELEIVEPNLMAGDLQLEKRTLIYSVMVSVVVVPDLLPRSSDPPSPPPADDEGRRRHRRQRRQRSSSASPPGAPASASRGNRTSVHARLGPHPAEIAHVAPQDGAVVSLGALLRDGSVLLDGIQDPAASASPEGASPPAIPRAAAGPDPEREASVLASPLADRAQHASAFSVGSLPQAASPCAPRINETAAAVLRKAQHVIFEDEGIKTNLDGADAEPVAPSTTMVQDVTGCTVDTLAGNDITSQPSDMAEASTWSPNLETARSSEDPGTTPPATMGAPTFGTLAAAIMTEGTPASADVPASSPPPIQVYS
ncbi:hypothetical protein BAE44_0014727 [Dichanthelium oligosanthes]|uniref:DUF4283 domain-containing protein n=1 Tax=Dichanthelium oligosanthes TaxID=888268 RepID=A0A1E5VGT0_9POAL|nr:hypothetical protein BAE44_0014727 [Dichanthelium oligosanthes]